MSQGTRPSGSSLAGVCIQANALEHITIAAARNSFGLSGHFRQKRHQCPGGGSPLTVSLRAELNASGSSRDCYLSAAQDYFSGIRLLRSDEAFSFSRTIHCVLDDAEHRS
jgi:hypothetical protein